MKKNMILLIKTNISFIIALSLLIAPITNNSHSITPLNDLTDQKDSLN